ncbi:hypothetical protein RND71_023965 [Anisodus tanguticus]|uniref:Protein kinase domain-containing protein n=1 Tax=Anisodus tanguticus TaxID=243964 RepID=A0AAE1RU51_9SOLA|nr:hypothetical protein RND71_023965 [Anisodus tanguticus]
MLMSGCDAKPHPRIQLLPGGDWYYALATHYSYTVKFWDPKLQSMLRQHKCQAFNKNISLPDSPSISFTIITLYNFFKCNRTSNNIPNITQKKNEHFAGYEMYNGCKGFSIYYKHLGDDNVTDIQADNLPANCSLIRLPIQSLSSNVDLFNLLGPKILVEWKLSDDCYQCHYGGGQCRTDRINKFHCSYPKSPHAQGKLKDGREVAVKRLYEHNCKRMQQFVNEIEILTRLRHNNLVTLYGCTSWRSRELLLVYEYIPNGTLADHLHGDKAKDRSLAWPICMNIAIETAAPRGTPGYIDPKYHECYQLTSKSDVYSFGVVLVELISSMPAVDMNRHSQEINLSNFAINKIVKGAFHELIDPSLGSDSDTKIWEMTTSVAELAFLCLQTDRDMRPTMVEVLDTLKEIQSSEFDNEKRAESNLNGNEAKIVTAPPFPETEDKLLLKQVKSLPSPNSVTDKWITCSSIITTK